MARPQKKGLDYFPLDVTMDKTNDDVEMLEAKYGVVGFTTLIKLYMKIYQEEGYFILLDEKASLLLLKRINVGNNSINVDINSINTIINDLVHWGVFDEKMYNDYKILTSRRIQNTYFDAIKSRKSVDVIEEYLLTEIVNDNINLINVHINPQRKEKNSKEEKRKEEVTLHNATPLEIAINDFVKFRKSIKKPMTEKALSLFNNKLNQLANDDETKIKIIEQSILNGWAGIFDLNRNNGYGKKQSNKIEPSQATKERYGEA